MGNLEKKAYLGYRPKVNNVLKLKQYLGEPVKQQIPSPKPLALNKKKNGK